MFIPTFCVCAILSMVTLLPLPDENDIESHFRVTYNHQDAIAATSVDTIRPSLPLPISHYLTKLESLPQPDSICGASAVAANHDFVCYPVKNGLIRVLHRQQLGTKGLLRAHSDQTITDLQFFHDGDVLASSSHSTVTNMSKIVIWRVFLRGTEIGADIMLEFPSTDIHMTRVVWHPFNPNQFWMLHHPNQNTVSASRYNKIQATLVESTRISTTLCPTGGHSVAQFVSPGILMIGATVLEAYEPMIKLQDLCWSTYDTRYVLTAHTNGDIILWDVKETLVQQQQLSSVPMDDGIHWMNPTRLCTVSTGQEVSRCLFLPYPGTVRQINANTTPRWSNCFVTGSDQNRSLTLWSAAGPNQKPQRLQSIRIVNTNDDDDDDDDKNNSDEALLLTTVTTTTSHEATICWLVMCGTHSGRIYVVQCCVNKERLLRGCNALTIFQSGQGIRSVQARTIELASNVDVQLMAYQSSSVQSLTLPGSMIVPDGDEVGVLSEKGVTVESIVETKGVVDIINDGDGVVAAGGSQMDGAVEFEEYEVDDIDNDMDEEPPSSSAMLPSMDNAPFSNWLGAMAAMAVAPTADVQAAVPPPKDIPVPPLPTLQSIPPPPPPPPSDFLMPRDFVDVRGNGSFENEVTTAATVAGIVSSIKTVPVTAAAIRSANSTPVVDNTNHDKDIVNDRIALVDSVHRLVREEVRTTVLPTLQQVLTESTRTNIEDLLQPLQSSLETLTKQQEKSLDETLLQNAVVEVVRDSVQDPLRGAFTESMKTVLIPAVESITGQVMDQVSKHLEIQENNQKEFNSSIAYSSTERLESMSQQISTLMNLVADLSNQVQSLQSVVLKANHRPEESIPASAVPPPPPLPPVPKPDPVEVLRQTIMTLLGKREFQEAFSLALQSSRADVTQFCCLHSNLNEVLGGTHPPRLSQPILLCLMQQLGTLLVNVADVSSTIDWLQEVALSLNSSDPEYPTIQRHVGGVLKQVNNHIHTRLSYPDCQQDAELTRRLQRLLHVVRGVMT